MTECNGIKLERDVCAESRDKAGLVKKIGSLGVNGEAAKSKCSEDSGYATCVNGNLSSSSVKEEDRESIGARNGTPDSEEVQNDDEDDVFMHSDDLNSESNNEDDIPVGCDADCNGAMALAVPAGALHPSGAAPIRDRPDGNDMPSTFALNSACRVFDFIDESTEADAMHLTVNRSMSECSEGSWSSAFSTESHQDEVTLQCKEFMDKFVNLIFSDSGAITQTEKAKFGQLCQYSAGRLWFARFVNAQRVNSQRVTEQTFYRLVQFFAVCLFECDQADDFVPAKSLMNMCFTFYHEHEANRFKPAPGVVMSLSGFPRNESKTTRGYLYSFLKDQPIWQSIRFWNAAFFDAVHCEREQRSPVHRENWRHMSSTEREDTQQQDENITFGQLGTFTNNMMAFGLSRDLCIAFLDKQSTIGNLSKDQWQLLKDNIQQLDKMRSKSPPPSPRSKFLAGLKTKFSKPPKTKAKSE